MMKSIAKRKLSVMVAKDVIAQLRAKRFRAKVGFYLTFPRTFNAGESLQCALKETKKPCGVCAIGGVFASLVRLKNKFNISKDSDGWALLHRDDMESKIHANCFDREELDALEAAFERTHEFGWFKFPRSDQLRKAVDFGRKFGNAHERMIGIMQNIIKNKGMFKP